MPDVRLIYLAFLSYLSVHYVFIDVIIVVLSSVVHLSGEAGTQLPKVVPVEEEEEETER